MVADGTGIRLAILLVLGGFIAYVWHLVGRGRWYEVLDERFIYGVPWGTLVTMVGVIGFYLFAQSGLTNWSDPVVHAFRSWSYTYPLGWLSAGFAHAGPNHLLSNMLGTLVLAPIVEYAYGHYPPSKRERRTSADRLREYVYPPPTATDAVPSPAGTPSADGPGGLRAKLRTDPRLRAFVVVPLMMIVVSILTSFFALGWSLGFSGTVFALLGFALIYYPITTVIAMVALTAVNVIVAALRQPVLVATTDPGAPGPPGWAGVNVQAHMLGFLIGILLALALLSYRNERPDVGRVAFATVLVVMIRSLWSLALGSDEVYRQYRGIGVVFVLALSFVIVATVAARGDRTLPGPSRPSLLPTYRRAAWGWLVLLVAGGALILLWQGLSSEAMAAVVATIAVLGIPSLPVLLPGRFGAGPLTYRHLFVGALVLITVIIALPSLIHNLPGMAEDPVPEGEVVEIEDYTITYAENASHGRINTTDSGVIVVSEQREIWSNVVRQSRLAHSGDATVTVGGLGWREELTANRSGWDVAGNDSAYVVDLEYDGEVTRAFESDPVTAQSRIANRSVHVEPTAEAFVLNVTRDGESLGRSAIPALNESIAVGGLDFATEPHDDGEAVFASRDGTRILIAEEETY